MKFAKQLAYNAVPEWRTKYIRYALFKKQLKRIQSKAKDRRSLLGGPDVSPKYSTSPPQYRSSLHVPNLSLSPDVERGEASPLISPEVDEEATFFRMLQDDINTINHFYVEKEEEYKRKVKELSAEVSLSGSARPDNSKLKSDLTDLYRELHELRRYVELNQAGFDKILKKFDKVCGRTSRPAFLASVHQQQFSKSKVVPELISEVEDTYARLFDGGDKDKAALDLSNALTHMMMWTRNTVWRDLISRERKVSSVVVKEERPSSILKPFRILICVIVGAGFYIAPILDQQGQEEAHRCLALLAFVSLMWASEAMPLYVTSLLVPLLVILSRVLLNPATGRPLDVSIAVRQVLGKMMDPVIMLVLGGFTIASALSKYDIDKLVAQAVLKRSGTRPGSIMLTVMLLGLFLSMWISNVASPVLCVSLIQPILRDLPTSHPYLKALLLGIAFACNIGGMTTPIASPQNAVALQSLQALGHTINFMTWMLIAVPIALLLVIIAFFFLQLLFRSDLDAVPPLHYHHVKFGASHVVVISVTIGTIVLWFLGPIVEGYFGHMGIVALIPVVMFFGSGLLPKEDFNNLPWNVLFLMGGGIALGAAVQSSRLLDMLTHALQLSVVGYPVWIITVIFDIFVMIVTTLISHTAGALIVLPIIAQVGLGLSHPKLMVMSSAMMVSGAMALPVSSFPNVNSMSVEDEGGRMYLRVSDLVKAGTVMTLITAVILVTAGYAVMDALHF